MQKIVIVESLNITPEEKVNEAIMPLLQDGYRVTSATTALALQGTRNTDPEMGDEGFFLGVAKHTYYVTTVVMEK